MRWQILFRITILACLGVSQLALAERPMSFVGERLQQALENGNLKNAKVISSLAYRAPRTLDNSTEEILSMLFDWLHEQDPVGSVTSSKDLRNRPRLTGPFGQTEKRELVASIFVERIYSGWRGRGEFLSYRSYRYSESLGEIDQRSRSPEEAKDLKVMVSMRLIEQKSLVEWELVRLAREAVFANLHEVVRKVIFDSRMKAESLLNLNVGSILNFALRHSDLEMLKVLLEHPEISVNFKTQFERHPLSTAVIENDVAALELLLNHPSFHPRHDLSQREGNSALHTTAQRNNFKLGQLLVEKYKYRLWLKNHQGVSPAYFAIENGASNWLAGFIESGARLDFFEIDRSGITAFQRAIQKQETRGIRTILNSQLSSSEKMEIIHHWAPQLQSLTRNLERHTSSFQRHGVSQHSRRRLRDIDETLILLEDLKETFDEVARGLGKSEFKGAWQ